MFKGGFALQSNSSSSCDTPYEWANKYLGECVTTPTQLAGLFFGLFSILCWVFAQAPQLYKNYKQKDAGSLSIIFLAEWLTGDITNLVGCILTKQVATQLYTAIYFCVIDTLMVVQWIYYDKIAKTAKKSTSFAMVGAIGALAVLPVLFVLSSSGPAASSPLEDSHRTGRSLLEIHSFHGTSNIIGYAIGCVSGVLYFTSRLPQLWKNYQRKSTEGLSLVMFFMAITGNVTYALGVLLQGHDGDFIIDHLPWLVGSIGTSCFDLIIFGQYFYYGRKDKALKYSRTGINNEANKPLLAGDEPYYS